MAAWLGLERVVVNGRGDLARGARSIALTLGQATPASPSASPSGSASGIGVFRRPPPRAREHRLPAAPPPLPARQRRQAQRPARPTRQQRRGRAEQRVHGTDGRVHRRLQEHVARRLACGGRALQLGAEGGSGRAGRSDSGGAGTPSARDDGHLAHVLVALVGEQRRLAVTLMSGEEAVDLGDVHPSQQVRIVGGVGAAVRRDADDALVHADAQRPAPPLPWDRTWSPPGSRRCAGADATGRCGSRCARLRLPSPVGAATAAAARATRRRTSRCRRGRADDGVLVEPPLAF